MGYEVGCIRRPAPAQSRDIERTLILIRYRRHIACPKKPAAYHKQLKQIDILASMRLRQRRLVLGMSQQQLGDRAGIAFQQIQNTRQPSTEWQPRASRSFHTSSMYPSTILSSRHRS
jgi:hypothetical protein